jgi:hypothetical protein
MGALRGEGLIHGWNGRGGRGKQPDREKRGGRKQERRVMRNAIAARPFLLMTLR